jgi:hypothetical protein
MAKKIADRAFTDADDAQEASQGPSSANVVRTFEIFAKCREIPQGKGLLLLTRDLCFGGANFKSAALGTKAQGRTLSRCNRLGRHGGTFAT